MANRKNSEGYSDPTAYTALSAVEAEEAALQQDVYNLVQVLKYIIRVSGFELVNRIEIQHKSTGRIFR